MAKQFTAARSMSQRLIVGVSRLGSAFIAMPGFARAQDNRAAQNSDIGKQKYRNYCAVCHGADAK